MITYKQTSAELVEVYLDNKFTGSIKKVTGGFQYQPKGTKDSGSFGEVYKFIYMVKKSLEEEE